MISKRWKMKWTACPLTWRQSLSSVLASVALFKTSTNRLPNSQVRSKLSVCFVESVVEDAMMVIVSDIVVLPCSVSGVHTLLRKLQFLFELPARLNKCLEMQAYAQAVRSHRRARCVLQQYSHLPSFKGIQDDCHAIMDKLAQELRQKFRWESINLNSD